jgi:threonine dehydrogenase-like Zn-dependent dehydrogenase
MAADTARAFWVAAPGRGEIREEPISPPGGDEVLIRTEYSGISRGTEALVFNGRVPATEMQRMRAPFQRGDFPAPVKYGYAAVGVVEAGPSEVRGRHVFVLHPHQTRFVVPAGAVHVLPHDVPPKRAILAATLETAITGIWDARPHVGDRVTIVGGGAVGCLVAFLAGRVIGCEVELVDVNAKRAAIARILGVGFAVPADARPDADVVVHASATAAGLDTALRVAGFESVIVELSWYGGGTVPAPLGEAFHARRLTVRSSQVSHIPPVQRVRWTTARRMALALRLLADPLLDCIINGESEFESLPATMAMLAGVADDALCHRVTYV